MPSSEQITPHTRRMFPERGFQLRYRRDSPVGSPPTSAQERAIDDLIRGVFLDFDFAPIFSGDTLRARLVATDLYNELISRAEVEASFQDSLFTVADVETRWKALIDKQIETIMVFRRSYQGLLSRD